MPRESFHFIFIDESGEALEPEVLVPLQLAGASHPTHAAATELILELSCLLNVFRAKDRGCTVW